jgi:hypothetical protein
MRVGGARGFGIVVWLLGILQTSACASDLVFEDGRHRHRLRHYSIANPGGEGSAWRRVEVDGAELAFQGPDRATMSLIEQCGRSRAEPRVLARQLWIGLEGRTLVDEGPVGADGSRGWIQRLDATANGETVRLKTVTRLIGECSYDWILVVPSGLEGPETAFDQWWKSFRGPTPAAEREEAG